mmetsp:Transcript_174835/g.425375  ORF Transcript_174835/g.425375 Transcript_174835/m.425375 type:complete len:628 (+) Transcript_174835:160-2043(+)
MVLELTFQRASVHPVHDAKRLEDGKDLNDALLDFFVKLGQALIPENSAAGAPPPVAFLGSHFFDVLRKGGVKDGREGHKNVANWAKRRLGKEGIFSDGIGALAVPVNEVLWNSSYDGKQPTQEKHWWLALLLNPRAAAASQGSDEDVSLLCLDSFVRTETSFEPPHRALKGGGSLEGYPAEVFGLSREGFNVRVLLRARGDGSAGPLPEPRKSRLRAGGREFGNTDHEFKTRDLGAAGKPGCLECSLSFRLDRRGAAKTGGEYVFAYGDAADSYQPALKLRMGEKPTAFQAEVARFLGGYLAKERETALGLPPCGGKEAEEPKATQLESAVCLPGVPQQETAHDCGFFILEMILRALQLSPKALRELATASAVEIAMLPWPSQRQVFRRKAMLRDALDALLVAARQHHTGDVEAILKADSKLRLRIRSALLEGGPSFTHGFERWAIGDWDLSASPSRSKSRSLSYRGRTEGAKKAKKKRRRGSSSSSEDASGRRRRRRRGRSTSESARSRSRSSASRSRGKAAPMAKAAPAQAPASPPRPPPPSYTLRDLEAMGAGALRALCMQRNVLPVGIVERIDLVKALAPFAAAPAHVPAPAPAPVAAPAKTEPAPAPAAPPSTIIDASEVQE